ncbi:hypothetical protein [Paenibacillus larvae]|nr:hypothetical protein [Paenibacillus larvae]
MLPVADMVKEFGVPVAVATTVAKIMEPSDRLLRGTSTNELLVRFQRTLITASED